MSSFIPAAAARKRIGRTSRNWWIGCRMSSCSCLSLWERPREAAKREPERAKPQKKMRVSGLRQTCGPHPARQPCGCRAALCFKICAFLKSSTISAAAVPISATTPASRTWPPISAVQRLRCSVRRIHGYGDRLAVALGLSGRANLKTSRSMRWYKVSMQRTPEPELMDDREQAAAYAAADWTESHGKIPGYFRERCALHGEDRKSTRLNSSHITISYAVFCLKKKKQNN